MNRSDERFMKSYSKAFDNSEAIILDDCDKRQAPRPKFLEVGRKDHSAKLQEQKIEDFYGRKFADRNVPRSMWEALNKARDANAYSYQYQD